MKIVLKVETVSLYLSREKHDCLSLKYATQILKKLEQLWI